MFSYIDGTDRTWYFSGQHKSGVEEEIVPIDEKDRNGITQTIRKKKRNSYETISNLTKKRKRKKRNNKQGYLMKQ